MWFGMLPVDPDDYPDDDPQPEVIGYDIIKVSDGGVQLECMGSTLEAMSACNEMASLVGNASPHDMAVITCVMRKRRDIRFRWTFDRNIKSLLFYVNLLMVDHNAIIPKAKGKWYRLLGARLWRSMVSSMRRKIAENRRRR